MLFTIVSTNECYRHLNVLIDWRKLMLKQVTGEVLNLFVKQNSIATPRTSYEAMGTVCYNLFRICYCCIDYCQIDDTIIKIIVILKLLLLLFLLLLVFNLFVILLFVVINLWLICSILAIWIIIKCDDWSCYYLLSESFWHPLTLTCCIVNEFMM